jgi:hypothetical protein
MAITAGPSLRSSIGVTIFASIQGVGASPYRKKAEQRLRDMFWKNNTDPFSFLVVRHGETEKPTKNLQGRGIKRHPAKSPQ